MENTKVTWTRQSDGKYIKTGDLPAGTRQVTLEIAGRPASGTARTVNEAVKIIENSISSGHARAEWYAIVPIAGSTEEASKAAKKSKKASAPPTVVADSSPAVLDENEARIAHIQETRGVTRKQAIQLVKKEDKSNAKAAKKAEKAAAKAAKKEAKKAAKAAKPKAAKAPKADKPKGTGRKRAYEWPTDDSDLPALFEEVKNNMRDPNRVACKHGHPISLENMNKACARRRKKYDCWPCVKAYASGEYKK